MITNITSTYVDYDMCKWLIQKLDNVSGKEGKDNIILGLFSHGINWGAVRLSGGLFLTSDSTIGITVSNAINTYDLSVMLSSLVDD